jgi:hypothetical protein
MKTHIPNIWVLTGAYFIVDKERKLKYSVELIQVMGFTHGFNLN